MLISAKMIPVQRFINQSLLLLYMLFLLNSEQLMAEDFSRSFKETNNHYFNTGRFLLDEAIMRYWTGSGSVIGSIAILDRASITYDYIANPAIRYYFMAYIELYKGFIVSADNQTSKAKNYFKKAMQLAEFSLQYQDSSDAFRIRAEGGYAWLQSKKLRYKPKLLSNIDSWIQNALYIAPGNIEAELLKIQIQMHRTKKKAQELIVLSQRLKALEAQGDIDKIVRFRIRILLHDIYTKMKNAEEAKNWLNKAIAIFPNNFMVQDRL